METVDQLIEKAKEQHNIIIQYYKEKRLTLQDHYYHLYQLYLIYPIMETALKKILASNVELSDMPNELLLLVQRSKEIEKDLKFLELRITENKRNMSFVSTDLYIKYLSKLNPNENSDVIWSHFFTRIFSDLMNVNEMKKYIKDIYTREGLSFFSETDGLHFYSFKSETLDKLKTWVETNKIFPSANTLVPHFLQPGDQLLFNDTEGSSPLECNEPTKSNLKQINEQSKPMKKNLSQSFCNFFTSRNVAIGTAALTAGVLLVASHYNKNH